MQIQDLHKHLLEMILNWQIDRICNASTWIKAKHPCPVINQFQLFIILPSLSPFVETHFLDVCSWLPYTVIRYKADLLCVGYMLILSCLWYFPVCTLYISYWPLLFQLSLCVYTRLISFVLGECVYISFCDMILEFLPYWWTFYRVFVKLF